MRRVLLCFILLVCNLINGQKFSLGKVSIEELKETQHPKDTTAVAAILWARGDVRFEYVKDVGFEMINDVEIRIKIYKKEGYNWADKSVRYYLSENNSLETVDFKNATTYNLIDGKIEKSKLKNEGIFDEKINKYWGAKKISMPNVKEGSIVEYKYTIRSPRIGAVRDWNFQSSIPVNNSEYVFTAPEFYEFKSFQRGFVFPKFNTIKNKKIIDINFKIINMSGSVRTTSDFYTEKFEYENTQTTYIAKDLPAIKDESYVNNINNYISSVSHELSMVKYPNEPVKFFATDWESVAKKIYEYDNFGPELNKTRYFEEDITKLLTGLSNQDEKIQTIFNYVKKSVKWNGNRDFTCDNGVRKAYKDKLGNVGDINLMLTAMLRFGNLDANPVLVSTRDNGIAFFPSTDAYNYVIVSVKTDEGLILLDATEKYSSPNILPIRDLNGLGRLIRKNGSSEQVNLMPESISRDVTSIMATISKDGVVEGKVREQHLDYNALQFREKYNNLSNDIYLEKLEKRHNDIEIAELKIKGKEEFSALILEDYSFTDNRNVEIIGDKIYFSPLLFLAQQKNPFKEEKREYPIDFVYPNENKYMINLIIPQGYVVESLPSPISFKTSNNSLSFNYSISNSENKLQLVARFNKNTSIIAPDSYDETRSFFDELVKKENEKVVLKKI